MKLRRALPSLKKGIETVPLINIVFLLLLFFLFTSSFVFQPGVRVELPKSSQRLTSGVSGTRYVLAFSAQQGGRIYFNDEVLSPSALFAQLKEIARKEAHPVIVVRADKNLSHGYMSEMVQMITELGFLVILATQ